MRQKTSCFALLATWIWLNPCAADTVDESAARKAGEAAVKSVIPRKIDYNKLKFSLVPFGVKVKEITLSENERFAKHPLRTWPFFARAQEVSLTADLLPLFIGRISVNDLAIQHFQANILVDKDYSLSVGDLLQQKRGPLINWLRIKNFHATDGSINIVDATAAQGAAKLSFDKIDARFTGFAVKEKFNMDISLRTPQATQTNVSLRGMAGPLNSVKSNQMPIDGVLTVNDAPILPFLAYAPKNLTAYPVSGVASMKLQLKGNTWDGMSSQGGIQFDNMVLAAPDGKQRGKAFSMGLDIGHNVFSLKRNSLDINNMAMTIHGNKMTVNGVVRGIPKQPVMDINLRANGLEPTKMEEVYPFVRAYLPKNLSYSGTTNLNIDAQGDTNNLTATGLLDSSALGVLLPEVFEKKQGSKLKVDFNAKLVPSQFTIKASAKVQGEDIKMLNARLFKDGLRAVLANRLTTKQLDHVFKTTEQLNISTVEGVMNYENNYIRLDNMQLKQLTDNQGIVADAAVTGSLAVNSLLVRWDVNARLSKERSQQLVKIAPNLATLTDNDGRIPFAFKVEGYLDKELKVSLQ
ncbi:MAG TPA: DUF748 domain-containing protein [Agitococcus sp.]|nr:DUF748 domain-containing protein [Agitococcus sp.]